MLSQSYYHPREDVQTGKSSVWGKERNTLPGLVHYPPKRMNSGTSKWTKVGIQSRHGGAAVGVNGNGNIPMETLHGPALEGPSGFSRGVHLYPDGEKLVFTVTLMAPIGGCPQNGSHH